jgi:hypothetical protein
MSTSHFQAHSKLTGTVQSVRSRGRQSAPIPQSLRRLTSTLRSAATEDGSAATPASTLLCVGRGRLGRLHFRFEIISISRTVHVHKQAVANQRKLKRIIEQMQKLSRQILFDNVPGVIRRKRLTRKV